VVVNTCFHRGAAREHRHRPGLADLKAEGSRLVVTGCMAERYRQELADALPEVDVVAGFGESLTGATAAAPAGTPVTIGTKPVGEPVPAFDLLNLPRPRSTRPWAYVKVAEGCDRACGFCAIPSFRGPQRSRSLTAILDEVDQLQVREVVLVAQDLAAYGRDQGVGERSIIPLVEAVADRVDRTRLLYLYPSDLTDGLIDAILATGVPYFDLSLQHVSAPLVRRMRRWGNGEKYLARIADIRAREPEAAFRSNFIVGFPGETEDDHDQLLRFVEEAQVDWCGFFAYSPEDGTYAVDLDGQVPRGLMEERLAELRELQDAITAGKRDRLIGSEVEVLVDTTGIARSHREAPEIDGIISVPDHLPAGSITTLTVTGALGPDLHAS
jgi:ribosomal protein S12 methylthiotransferase